jgi:Ala-tRNA(Pro) deacylase
MAIAGTVKAYLESLNVDYELVTHPRTGSSRESAAAARVPEDHIAKGVLLQDASGYVLAVVPGSTWIRLHSMQVQLNRELELAPEEDLARLFSDCDPGAIPCTGMAYGIETVVDEAFNSLAYVYFESGDHRHLVRVSGEDFHKLASGLRHGHFGHEE